jgi:hypothetical protein
MRWLFDNLSQSMVSQQLFPNSVHIGALRFMKIADPATQHAALKRSLRNSTA